MIQMKHTPRKQGRLPLFIWFMTQ